MSFWKLEKVPLQSRLEAVDFGQISQPGHGIRLDVPRPDADAARFEREPWTAHPGTGAPVPVTGEPPPVCSCGSDTTSSIRLLSDLKPRLAGVEAREPLFSANHADARKKASLAKPQGSHWFRALGPHNGLNGGLQLRDVVGLAQHRGPLLLAQGLDRGAHHRSRSR